MSWRDNVGLMNNTKWDEVRLAMYNLSSSPQWRTKDIESGYVSEWDREWFYHFREGGYEMIEWVEIRSEDAEHKSEIIKCLEKIRVPGEIEGRIIRVYGYAVDKAVNYL